MEEDKLHMGPQIPNSETGKVFCAARKVSRSIFSDTIFFIAISNVVIVIPSNVFG